MSLFILILCLFSAVNAFYFLHPVDIDKCRDLEWIHRDYIVYVCHANETNRSLQPWGCDPSHGENTHNNKPPMFVNTTRFHKLFNYECKKNETDGSIAYQAIACFAHHAPIKPGDVVSGPYMSTIFCYKDLDGILRMRVQRPVHNHCSASDPTKLECKMGMTETIYNSDYGRGEPFSIDVITETPKGPARRTFGSRVNETRKVPKEMLVKAITRTVDLDTFLQRDRLGY